MARASFGGAQDLSGVFSSLYNQYADRLESLAERGERRAEDDQAAADRDMLDQWQDGAISDEALLEYARARLDATADDPEQNAQWADIIRDTEAAVKGREISETAEQILDGIAEGTRTWQQLRDFYTRERKALRPNDPLYKQISEQINDVNDRIRDNEVAGGFERIEYQFRAGQISGSAAGAAIRKMAARYKTNDPQRYYELLQSAVELEEFGGMYGASRSGGGGGGRGGGGGGGGGNLGPTIDSLKGLEARIRSLSMQFDSGATIGTDPEAGEIVLRNPDGTPSADMKALDGQILDTFDALREAYIADGDQSAADNMLVEATTYITQYIQPRNTIAKEQQLGRLQATTRRVFESALNASDPQAALRDIQRHADRVERWAANLNVKRTKVQTRDVDEEQVRENPELRVATTAEQRTTLSREEATTGDFASQALGFADFLRSVAYADDPGAAFAAAEQFAGEEGVTFFREVAEAASITINLANLIGEGRATRVLLPPNVVPERPEGGAIWLPNVARTVPDVNGRPTTIEGPMLPEGLEGMPLAPVIAKIDGKMQAVQGVAQRGVWVVSGAGTPQQQGVFVAEGQYSESDLEGWMETPDVSVTGNVTRVGLPGVQNGDPSFWYGIEGQEGWFKNRVPTGGSGAPTAPIITYGGTPQEIQTYANQNGLDPTGIAFTKSPDVRQSFLAEFKRQDVRAMGQPQTSEQTRAKLAQVAATREREAEARRQAAAKLAADRAAVAARESRITAARPRALPTLPGLDNITGMADNLGIKLPKPPAPAPRPAPAPLRLPSREDRAATDRARRNPRGGGYRLT